MEDLLTVTGASDPSDITPVGSLKGYEFLFENGGNSTTEYAKVIKGNSVGILPTTTREGYIFDGWYTSLEFTTEVTENTIPNGYLTYYAKWLVDIENATLAHNSYVMEIGDEDDIVITTSDTEPVTYSSGDNSVVTVDENGHLTAVGEGTTTVTITGTKSGKTKTVSVRAAL